MPLTVLSRFHGGGKQGRGRRRGSQTYLPDIFLTWPSTLCANPACPCPTDLATPAHRNRTSRGQSRAGPPLTDRLRSLRLPPAPLPAFLTACRILGMILRENRRRLASGMRDPFPSGPESTGSCRRCVLSPLDDSRRALR